MVQHEPHQTGRVNQGRVGQSRDAVVLEVQVLYVGGDGGHGCQAPPIAVHGDWKSRGAVAHIWTDPHGSICLCGIEIAALSVAGVEPPQRVIPVGERERKQSRQKEGDEACAHDHKSAAFSE